MTFDEMEAALRERLEALPPTARAELIHVLRLPDFDRADRIGESGGTPTRTFGELLDRPGRTRREGGRRVTAGDSRSPSTVRLAS